MALYGGVEAGGTKFVCMVAGGPEDIRAEATFPTTTPRETIALVVDFFRRNGAGEGIEAVGVGSFGPVDLDPASPSYGHITSTPKPGWAQTDIVGMLRNAMGLLVAFDTDVNCAAYGEYRWGACQGLDQVVYVTVGTGIGGGVVSHGKPLHGLVHPEIGHMLVPHDRDVDPYAGRCPYHRDCLEGLAAGPALMDRWGQRGETLPDDHPAWELEAHYLGLALANLILCLSPGRIAIGGGVLHSKTLLPLLRRKVQQLLNGYVRAPQIADRIDEYVVSPGLGDRAGVLGAIALAQDSLARPTHPNAAEPPSR